MKTVELANCIDPNEVTHNELLNLVLHCLPFSLYFSVFCKCIELQIRGGFEYYSKGMFSHFSTKTYVVTPH